MREVLYDRKAEAAKVERRTGRQQRKQQQGYASCERYSRIGKAEAAKVERRTGRQQRKQQQGYASCERYSRIGKLRRRRWRGERDGNSESNSRGTRPWMA